MAKGMSELLREAIANADSLLGIHRATGLDRHSLRRFRNGHSSLRLDLADRLAKHFGITCRKG